MMHALPFLVKIAHNQYVQAPRIQTRWAEHYRTKREHSVAGLGTIREVEAAGIDRSRLLVWPSHESQEARPRPPRVLRADGQAGQAGRGAARTVAASAAALKGTVRRLRAQEAAGIAAADARIAAALAELADARAERKRAVAAAWVRGNVVRLNECTPVADGPTILTR